MLFDYLKRIWLLFLLNLNDNRRVLLLLRLESFKKHFPYSAPEGLQELERIAPRLEENVYSAATSQSDYLRKISLKMLTLETQSQSTMANSPQTGSSGQCQQNSSTVALMNDNNWRGSRAPMIQPQAGTIEQSMISSSASSSPMVLDGWRAQIPPGSRQRITNKILETLKVHLPYCGQEGLHELERIAVRFEEKIYSVATSQIRFFSVSMPLSTPLIGISYEKW